MSVRTVSIEEKIKAVEDILVGLRRGGAAKVAIESGDALKEIAKDLRARLPGRQSEVAAALERRLEAVEKSKHPHGYGTGAMIGVAQEIIRHWPVIRQALEREEAP